MTPTAIERAFELARSGEFRSVAQIRARLKVEGYDPWHVQGRALQQQLKAIIADSRRLAEEATRGMALRELGTDDVEPGAD